MPKPQPKFPTNTPTFAAQTSPCMPPITGSPVILHIHIEAQWWGRGLVLHLGHRFTDIDDGGAGTTSKHGMGVYKGGCARATNFSVPLLFLLLSFARASRRIFLQCLWCEASACIINTHNSTLTPARPFLLTRRGNGRKTNTKKSLGAPKKHAWQLSWEESQHVQVFSPVLPHRAAALARGHRPCHRRPAKSRHRRAGTGTGTGTGSPPPPPAATVGRLGVLRRGPVELHDEQLAALRRRPLERGRAVRQGHDVLPRGADARPAHPA
ncbi:hypothetical protein ISF_00731 [Cordyceps fumosorosea ARSEF 2679]|uniref:Uncharacterized protein n=1 Tax=Cordyceps fumosorosea (strain ARSEF 2679) TaxID=1081104 RepID=A0A168EHZ7_CORFA|nr:hypothetical protein ISF_00731 [Cordyceps fumosorosea ARSEF 2679]OAA73830.1 hypothetical protein ISF_00731 [Cordyceps fumosorosea ARSEF 2679]